MEYLIDLGIDDVSLKMMLELNPEIKDLDESEIKEKTIILSNLNCSDSQIRNIVVSNSLFLTRSNNDIMKLIKKLLELSFKDLNILFDSNPFILNLEPFEIDEYINSRLKNNELLENIIDDLETNTYLFNEI